MLYPNDNGLEPPSEFIKKLIGSVEQQEFTRNTLDSYWTDAVR